MAFSKIAATAKVNEGHLRRILRLAMTNNIFCEPRVGFVAHTAESSTLVRDKGTLNWIGYTSEESFPASGKVVEATKKYGASEEKNHSAWNIAFDTELPIFEFLAYHKIAQNDSLDDESIDQYGRLQRPTPGQWICLGRHWIWQCRRRKVVHVLQMNLNS